MNPPVRTHFVQLAILLTIGALALSGGCAPSALKRQVGPPTATVSRTVVPSTATSTPAPTATAVPTQTPFATPAPTLGPETVAETIARGQRFLASQQADPLCLRQEDTDGDGSPEWIGLYLQAGEPPQLLGFILDGDIWHVLAPPAEDEQGLGSYADCTLDVGDINADGRTEILIGGHAANDVDLLHVFVWTDATYELLASFQGNAGVEVQDTDGDLVREIVARYEAGGPLAWEAIHTWDGTHYGWTWERYAWLYADHPHAYLSDHPRHAVISYYLALNDRDLPAAYGMLTSHGASSQSYETWAAGFDTLLSAGVGSVLETEKTGDTARVTAQVRSYENIDGYVIGQLWDVAWTLVREGEGWRLQESVSRALERWEAPYFD